MKILKVISSIVAVVLVASGTWLLWPTHTPAFVDQQGQVLPHSIAEVERVDINGLSQWTLTRARDLSNPVLLVLHGGPGASEFALFRAYNSALEDHFVVVHWEQRGTGKSFDPDTPVHSMNPEQFIADLDQLVDHLRAKFGRERIALLGHSWGSIMGTIYSARYPQKLSGYIGTGQIADMRANEQVSYEFALAQARQRSHEEAIAELEEIGPPPYSAEKTLQQRHWLNEFGGGVMHKDFSMPKLIWTSLSGPEVNLFDLVSYLRGATFTLEHMWDDVLAINLDQTYLTFEVPVFFMLGRHDFQTPAPLAQAYFERLQAPDKALFYFEQSAHSPPWEEPDLFLEVMVETIKPRLLPDGSSALVPD